MITCDEQNASDGNERESSFISAKSGLVVNVADDVWVVLPNNGKGQRLCVDWIYSNSINGEDRKLILDVVIYYVRTKAASTASGVISNTKPFLGNGIPTLTKIKSIWGGLRTNNKKGLNQFFGTLCKLGESRFDEYHAFTKSHLDKTRSNALDVSRGAFDDAEFDCLARQINLSIGGFEWGVSRPISFYRSKNQFGSLRNLVTNKLLLSIVRRPVQIALLKWSDLIPSGASFNDSNIRSSDEVKSIGAKTLQLRVFVAKSSRVLNSRGFPERYPIHLSETLSKILGDYKKVFLDGVSLLLDSLGIGYEQSELLGVLDNMPIFPDTSFFDLQFDSFDFFSRLFTPHSTAYHVSESAVAMAVRWVSISSSRTADCIATSNRIRHTVLTRGAQEGLPAAHLAKITGVTVPAARHYIDLDYKSRREIDVKYLGNDFLSDIFGGVLTVVSEGDDVIFDRNFNPIGGARKKLSCNSCSAVSGRPLGCYGCPNFRPILEADHRLILREAEEKLLINRSSLINPLYTRSVEKLELQVAWIKLTIDVCDEAILRRRALND
ncbi:TPA: hypothetical protein ACGWS1_003874 [Pseudomonas aeruginosa]|uniref:Uncharacterized protein n=2 Tax=Bacteria TaxID=2 RepID=A0A427HI69_ECTOL|nr:MULTISPECIES: hypothetical protein [Pseudomonadaceae]WOF80222.1 hypothetical protein P5704_007045 [Pseudomonas sp. FeN3W]AYZ80261.1 hypothetical protein EGY23_29040 [Pseudomonas aeruginosa]EIU7141933.1 hypothetical protein [Pseudomonas aeruginosa]EKV0186438.1 hypothetical protein [Pseudomonas aeruginosa]EKX5086726.1 hypothetical protein [Pseudomonas aeruginosa]